MTANLAADATAATLTLGIALYAAATLVCIGVGLDAARKQRRRLAIVMASVVGVLVVAGVVVAVLSSTHGPG